MEIAMVEGTRFLSKVIMKSLNCKVSHCAMRYSAPDERWIVHSSLNGVYPDWWDKFCLNYAEKTRFKAKFACADQALDNVVESLGHKNYDYLSLFGFAVVILLRKIGINLKKNPLGQANSYMCTEIVVAFFIECNKLNPALSFREFDPDLTDPGMLLDYLKMRVDAFDMIVEAA